MITWLTIGVCVEVAWMLYERVFIRLATFKDLFEVMLHGGLWVTLCFIGGIALNIIIWPLSLILNVINAAFPENLERFVKEKES